MYCYKVFIWDMNKIRLLQRNVRKRSKEINASKSESLFLKANQIKLQHYKIWSLTLATWRPSGSLAAWGDGSKRELLQRECVRAWGRGRGLTSQTREHALAAEKEGKVKVGKIVFVCFCHVRNLRKLPFAGCSLWSAKWGHQLGKKGYKGCSQCERGGPSEGDPQ